MSLIEEQAGFLKDIRKLLDFADAQGFLVTGGELERSLETQSAYVKSGLEASMDSPHLRKCAMTLNFFRANANDQLEFIQKPADLDAVGTHWETLDPRNRWCGRQGKLVDSNRFVRDLGGWQSSSLNKLGGIAATEQTQQLEAVATACNTRPGSLVLPVSNNNTPVIKPGTTDREAVTRMQSLLKKAGIPLEADGEFGEKTKAALISFQQQHQLVADAVCGAKTWELLFSPSADSPQPNSQKYIGDKDFQTAANMLGIELAALKAVYKVESNGKGFIGDLPKILFEGHIFWSRLKKLGLNPEDYVKGNEDILYPKWTKEFYTGGLGENRRLERAEVIHKEAARESASYGLFQIMGFHWKNLNYATVNEFVELMQRHERDQLDAFCRFVKFTKNGKGETLATLLENKNWAEFAYSYNGAEYRKNAYDDKLRENYRKFCTVS